MAFRKTVQINTIEPLAGTPANEALADYNSDKAFIEARYGVGGTNYNPQTTYEFDDANKKITITVTNAEWTQPQ